MRYYTDTELRVNALNAIRAVSLKEDGIQNFLIHAQYAFEYLRNGKINIEREKTD